VFFLNLRHTAPHWNIMRTDISKKIFAKPGYTFFFCKSRLLCGIEHFEIDLLFLVLCCFKSLLAARIPLRGLQLHPLQSICERIKIPWSRLFAHPAQSTRVTRPQREFSSFSDFFSTFSPPLRMRRPCAFVTPTILLKALWARQTPVHASFSSR